MKQYFYIAPKNASEVDVLFYGYIGQGEEGINAKSFVKEFMGLQAKYSRINVRINSPGGEVFEGAAIFNAIQNAVVDVYTYVDGVAASMAGVIAMAGKKVFMARNASLMLHKPSGGNYGQANDLRSTAELLDKLEGQLLAAFTEKTGKTEEEVKAWFQDGKDTWFDANEALAAGLIDEIVEPRAKKITAPKNLSGEELKNYVGRFTNELKIYIPTETNIMNKIFMLAGALQLPLTTQDEDVAFTAVEARVKAVMQENADLKTQNQALTDAAKSIKDSQVRHLIDSAIASKRLTESQRENFTRLANLDYDATKVIIDGMPAAKDLGAGLNGGSSGNSTDPRADWSWDKWSKEDPDGLLKMKRQEPDKYQALYKKEYSS